MNPSDEWNIKLTITFNTDKTLLGDFCTPLLYPKKDIYFNQKDLKCTIEKYINKNSKITFNASPKLISETITLITTVKNIYCILFNI